MIQIYFRFQIENLFETMNEELRKLANWFKANKLSLNISKRKYSLFHSARKRKDIPSILPPLHIDNVPVKIEFVTKFLGVYLDEKISWKHHINPILGGRWTVESTPINIREYFKNGFEIF